MSPANREEPGFELPQPHAVEGKPDTKLAEVAPVKSEQESRSVELPGSALPPVVPPSPPPSSSIQTTVPIDNSNPSQLPLAQGQANPPAPATADDADLIEKEWVDKAKAIVEHTKDDPHQQNKKLNEFKADYMKKRYSKDIRLSDE